MSDAPARKIDSPIGRVIAGKYRIHARIGEGTTGVVYEARQLPLDFRVAIKLIHRELQTRLSFVSRFHVEAKAASDIDHANITHVLDFGLDAATGYLYICMEYLEGRPLLEILRTDAALDPPRIVDILLQTLAALGAAHKLGILHRDLRPEKIVVLRQPNDEGRLRDMVKVCDFGVAQLEGGDGAPEPSPLLSAPSSSPALALGSLSPEQARGTPLDARSDLYSAGVLLYMMMTGHAPYQADSVADLVERQAHETLRPPSALAADVDPELDAICLRALSKAPTDRYGSAREMRAALRSTRAYRALMADGWAPEPPSTGVTVPPSFRIAESRGASSLNLQTPFVVKPVGERATVRPDQMDTCPPPPTPPASENSLQWETTENNARRAQTRPSLRRIEAPPKSARRAWLVPVAGAMVAALLGAFGAVGWRRSTPQAAQATAPPPTASPSKPGPPALSPIPSDPTTVPLENAPSAATSESVTVTPAASTSVATGALALEGSTRRISRASADSPAPASPANAPPVLAAFANGAAPVTAASTASSTTTTAPSDNPSAATSPAAVAPLAAPVPAVSAAAATPSFRPDDARVDVVKTETDRVNARSVNDAFRHANVQRCYVDALKRAGAARQGTAVLTLTIDESRVTSSTLNGVDLPGLSSCVAGQLTNARVANADTGTASASITLRFSLP